MPAEALASDGVDRLNAHPAGAKMKNKAIKRRIFLMNSLDPQSFYLFHPIHRLSGILRQPICQETRSSFAGSLAADYTRATFTGEECDATQG